MINPASPHGLLFALLLASSTFAADMQPVPVTLKGASEVPPVTTSAMGTGEIMVRPDHTVSGTVKFSGINPTMAHIHEGAPGKNAKPIVHLTKTAGDTYSVPANTKLTDAQYTSYLAGNLYINVHSANYPDGEIRGQVSPPSSAGMPMRPGY